MKNRKKGFTLVEVIVVLVILAILAGITVPALTGYIDKARQENLITRCRACVVAAQSLATEAYGKQGETEEPPASEEILALAGETGEITGIQLEQSRVTHLAYQYNDTPVVYCADPTTCEQHSQTYTIGAESTFTSQEYADFLMNNETVKEYFENHGSDSGKSLDSNATRDAGFSGYGNAVLTALQEQFGADNVKTFRIYKSDTQYNIFISDVDLYTLSDGERFTAQKYDAINKVWYTGTMTWQASSINGNTPIRVMKGDSFKAEP